MSLSELLSLFLEEYGIGLNVLGLLKFYRDNQHCVAKCGKYHRETFIPYCGATQGCVVSFTLLNMFVDEVVRKWLADITEDMITASAGL